MQAEMQEMQAEQSAATDGVKREADRLMSQVRDDVASADRQLRALVEERPLLTLLGAVAAGFVVGRVLSRL